MKSSYSSISNFGADVVYQDESPMSVCMFNTMDVGFQHGSNAYSLAGPESKACQAYLSDYCAQGWDGACELVSKNTNRSFPNQLTNAALDGYTYNIMGSLTQGDMLVRNTAAKKFAVALGNCKVKYEVFDPTVANSPFVSRWTADEYGRNNCVPIYAISDVKSIDSDPVMNKILAKPEIAMDILINIFNNQHKLGAEYSLEGTKLGYFFKSRPDIFTM